MSTSGGVEVIVDMNIIVKSGGGAPPAPHVCCVL
jgi:hypothetical protein